jgi:hypothetical protein
MRRLAILGALLVLAAIGFWRSLPPGPLALPARAPDGVRGAIHVHSRRSDGSGSPEQIAAAARNAGLQFVILTDHGDGTRTPSSPVYRGGVLLVDGLEVSGNEGHVVALGLPKTPYRLGGDGRDIVEDIARMGGMSIAAHPGSLKQELRWTEWSSPIHGLEWLNGDSESRDESWFTLARVLLSYPFSPAGSLASVLDRPETVLRRWDALTERRRVVAVAGTDAHARFDLTGDESGRGFGSLRIPGYEQMFEAFSVTAAGVRFTGDADQDAEALLDALRGGHVYSTVNALATPAAVSFGATRGAATWTAGDFVPDGGDLELRVDSNAPAGSRVVLIKNGDVLAEVQGSSLQRTVPGSRAVYRAEIHVSGTPGEHPVPWVVTNPIYVRAQDERAPDRGAAAAQATLYENGEAHGWTIETSPRSKAAIDVARTMTGTELLMRWAIGGTDSESPYAAFVMPAGELISGYDRLTFTARADRPMRVSVQFRLPNGDRWRRSVYVDEQSREVTVFFDAVRPAGPTATRRMPLASVRDVLFVFDTVNAQPGASGQFRIDDVKYGR